MMLHKRFIYVLVVVSSIVGITSAQPFPPCNPKATKESKILLQYLYDITGKGILTGVHGENWSPKRMYDVMLDETGRGAAFYDNDFRYGEDVYNRRRKLIEEIKNKWQAEKTIVGLMWHMTRMEQTDSNLWGNVQSPVLTTAETDMLLNPSSSKYAAWIAKLDRVAVMLKELNDLNIPVLWRPYHEMNGGWFWWGENPRFKELWIQMYERFTNHHGLNNLLWVWCPNVKVYEAKPIEDFYPGHKYVDVLASDIYANKSYDWEQYFHDDLLALGEGRPIAMGEVGDMPDPNFIKVHQPKWTMFLLWSGYEHQYANNVTRNKMVFNHEFSITRDELPGSIFDGTYNMTFAVSPQQQYKQFFSGESVTGSWPAKGWYNVPDAYAGSRRTLSVYNAAGRVVARTTIDQQNMIDLNALRPTAKSLLFMHIK